MNLIPLILEAVKQRGGAAVWAWVGLMLATWLVFAYGTDRPLKGTERRGAGFVYGVLVIGVSAVVAQHWQRAGRGHMGAGGSPMKREASVPRPVLFAVCSAFGLLVAGCATVHETTGPSRMEAGEAQVDLLARGFLVYGEPQSSGYGYYAYLVFLDAGESTRPGREAAIRAFAELVGDANNGGSSPVSRDELAVLYVPVKSRPQVTPIAILESYDYAFAQLLTVEMERRGAKLPRLLLIGSAAPLQPRSTGRVRDLQIVPLKGDPKAIEETVLRFRSSLMTAAKPAVAQRKKPEVKVLERVRKFFDSVGGFVLSVKDLGGSPSNP